MVIQGLSFPPLPFRSSQSSNGQKVGNREELMGSFLMLQPELWDRIMHEGPVTQSCLQVQEEWTCHLAACSGSRRKEFWWTQSSCSHEVVCKPPPKPIVSTTVSFYSALLTGLRFQNQEKRKRSISLNLCIGFSVVSSTLLHRLFLQILKSDSKLV